jgi:prepilin-type N-terminal cleavage/methylation domain-containing protein
MRPLLPTLRRGMTLIELLVVMAILVVIAAVAMPSISGLLDLQQRAGAKEMAQTIGWLVDEARMRNVSFRIAYNLDRRLWKVEVGDPDTLVYATPESREKAEDDLKDKMSRYTQRELEDGRAAADMDDEDGESTGPRQFEGLDDPSFTTGQELPTGTEFLFIYTPQYGDDGIRPSDDGPPDDPEDDTWAYSYIFPDGTAEHTVVRIVDEDDPDDGWTVEVDPLTGDVRLFADLKTPGEALEWLPEEGPTIR